MSGVRNGRPPISGRFPKGTSGNSKGRPKSRRPPSTSAFDIILDRTLTVTQGGKPRDLTVEEAMQHKTYQEAINGNRAAQREVLKMIKKREKWLSAKRPFSPPERAMEIDPDNANEALLLLGIAERDTKWDDHPTNEYQRLLLQPWAVQAALSRPGSRRLSAKDVSEIKLCTRDAEKLRWPSGVRDEPND